MNDENKKTILLVEDEVIIAMAEKMDLERYGYNVFTANTGAEAIKVFKDNQDIDLILMDINLGEGIDGTETAVLLLKERKIPVVFLSNHMEVDIVEKTEKITSYGYVVKNSGITVIDASIKMALKLFDAHQNDKGSSDLINLLRKEIINRKWVEKKANDALDYAESIIDSVTSPLLVLDDESKIISANKPFHDLFLLSLEQCLGRSCFQISNGIFNIAEFKELVSGSDKKESKTIQLYHNFKYLGMKHLQITCVNLQYNIKHLNFKLVIINDITSLITLEESIKEKELFLEEVHHRVKTSMNTINALLSLQADNLKDPSAIEVLQDTRKRVDSLGLLYETLNFSHNRLEFSVKDFLPSLIVQIIASFPNSNSIRIENNIDDFIMSSIKGQPLVLIINELLSNIMEHAFKNMNDGIIKVSASIKRNHVSMIVEDNGIGIPKSVDFENSTGVGLKLIGMLVKQIGGTIRIERLMEHNGGGNSAQQQGTRIILEFERIPFHL